MNRTIKTGLVILLAGAAWQAAGAPPPPPPGDGGTKPPDAPPPGKIYFDDNVVIVAPGVTAPKSDGGTVFITLDGGKTDLIKGETPDTTRQVRRTVETVNTAKTQVEAISGGLPPNLAKPFSLLLGLEDEALPRRPGVFGDAAFVHEEVAGADPARVDRTDQARAAGVAVTAEPGTAPPARPKRPVVTPSYWQLPIR